MPPNPPAPGSAPGGIAGHRAGSAPDGVVPLQVSLRRSRIGWWVPIFGMPVLLVLSLILAVSKATPPGIGIIAFFWALGQAVWAGGPTVTRRGQLPRVDRERMLMTGRSWTGHRTLDLTQLRRVRRVKWTFNSEYSSSRRVDYVVLTDRAGVWLTMPRRTAVEPVQWALAYQSQHGLPLARVSRFAGMGLGMIPSDIRFRVARTLALFVAVGGYSAAVMVLIVEVIPRLAGYHGG
jgi:hypothetical protein